MACNRCGHTKSSPCACQDHGLTTPCSYTNCNSGTPCEEVICSECVIDCGGEHSGRAAGGSIMGCGNIQLVQPQQKELQMRVGDSVHRELTAKNSFICCRSSRGADAKTASISNCTT